MSTLGELVTSGGELDPRQTNFHPSEQGACCRGRELRGDRQGHPSSLWSQGRVVGGGVAFVKIQLRQKEEPVSGCRKQCGPRLSIVAVSIPGSARNLVSYFLQQINTKVASIALIHAWVPACLYSPIISISSLSPPLSEPAPFSLIQLQVGNVLRNKWCLCFGGSSSPPHDPAYPTFKALHYLFLFLLHQLPLGLLSLFSLPSDKALFSISSTGVAPFLPQGLSTACSFVSPTFRVASSSCF